VREDFVALATLLRDDPASRPEETPEVARADPQSTDEPSAPRDAFDVLGEIARMRLAAREAFDGASARVLADLAHDVLARELALRPADIDALVDRALAAYVEHDPVEIVVSTADVAAVSARTTLPIRADDALARGDVVVRVRDGAFESPLAFRVAHALARARDE
jgi:hypothetical protein